MKLKKQRNVPRLMLPVIVFSSLILQMSVVKGSADEKRLIEYLFNPLRYNPVVRPVQFDHQTVNVTFNLALFQLLEINEKAQTMDVSAWLRQSWKDSLLSWDPVDYNGISEINLPREMVWAPDIVLYNNVHDDNAEYGGNIDTLKTRVIVSSSGAMYWLAPAIIKTSCRIDVAQFPFDTQHCKLTFGSWTYDMARLDVRSEGIDTDKFITNLEWNLVKKEVIRSEVKYSCCPNKYPDVTFHLYFQRRSLFYILNLIFPIAVITLLVTLSFVLPSESGERLSLAVTLMLATTVFMLLVAETTPSSSESVPLVAVYFILCMILMFCAIVLLCFISRMYTRGRTDKPIGRFLRRYIFDNLSYRVGVRFQNQFSDRKIPQGTVIENGTGILGHDSIAKRSGTDEVTQIRFLNNAFNKTIYKENRGSVEPLGAEVSEEEQCDGDKDGGNSNSSLRKRPSDASSVACDIANLQKLIKKLENHGILGSCCGCNCRGGGNGDASVADGAGDVKVGTTVIGKAAGGSENFTIEEEWRIVAQTFDKCLFCIFIFVFAIATISCFGHTSYIT